MRYDVASYPFLPASIHCCDKSWAGKPGYKVGAPIGMSDSSTECESRTKVHCNYYSVQDFLGGPLSNITVCDNNGTCSMMVIHVDSGVREVHVHVVICGDVWKVPG